MDATEELNRGVFLFGFIGDNGTGKTATAREIAIAWKQSRPGWDVMAFNPFGDFDGVANKFIELDNDNWWKDALELRNALLILDEVRILHPSNMADKRLLKLLSMRRAYNIDIIYIVHNPALVLEILTYFTSKYFIYYTQSKLGQFKNKMPNYTTCNGASMFINKYVAKNGKGQYPNFPYVIVDNQTDSLDCVGMTEQKIKKL